jgi:hypothetical protein
MLELFLLVGGSEDNVVVIGAPVPAGADAVFRGPTAAELVIAVPGMLMPDSRGVRVVVTDNDSVLVMYSVLVEMTWLLLPKMCVVEVWVTVPRLPGGGAAEVEAFQPFGPGPSCEALFEDEEGAGAADTVKKFVLVDVDVSVVVGDGLLFMLNAVVEYGGTVRVLV